MGFAFGAVACWGIIFLVIALLVGSVVLRGAVKLTNKCLGASANPFDPDDEELDEWIGYRRAEPRTNAIPEPGIGMGMVSVLLLAIVSFLAGSLVRGVCGLDPFELDEPEDGMLILVTQTIGFAIGLPVVALILAGQLPTTFRRACLVVLVNYLIILAIVLLGVGVGYILF